MAKPGGWVSVEHLMGTPQGAYEIDEPFDTSGLEALVLKVSRHA